MTRRGPSILAAVLAALCATVVAHDAHRIHRVHQFNRLLERGLYTQAGEQAGLHARLARGYAHHQRGHYEEALQAYTLAPSERGSRLERYLRFNLATLYLQRARESEAGDLDTRTPLIELAKENLREVLRGDPQDWDARYNLEIALSLQPEPPDLESEQTITPERTPRAPRVPMGYGGLP